MALPSSTNVTFDLYRGFNASNPYAPPNRPAAAAGLRGVLKHHVRAGRFGYFAGGVTAGAGTPLHWTNVLLVPLGTDVRSAYNAELNVWTPANADTVMVADYPVKGTCTAFLVVLVQRVDRGLATDHQRVYLDRAQPQAPGPCPNPAASGGGTVSVPCCPGLMPATLYYTIAGGDNNCALGSLPLVWNGTQWVGSAPGYVDGCGDPMPRTVTLFCDTGTGNFFVNDDVFGGTPQATGTCSPVVHLTGTIPFSGACCTNPENFTVTQ
jgi:hypothetical protein